MRISPKKDLRYTIPVNPYLLSNLFSAAELKSPVCINSNIGIDGELYRMYMRLSNEIAARLILNLIWSCWEESLISLTEYSRKRDFISILKMVFINVIENGRAIRAYMLQAHA